MSPAGSCRQVSPMCRRGMSDAGSCCRQWIQIGLFSGVIDRAVSADRP